MPVGQMPECADVRLHLEAGIAVVLQLGAEDEGEALRHQDDLVLHEPGEQVGAAAGRVEAEKERPADVVADPAVPCPDQHVVPPPERNVILQVEVRGPDHQAPVEIRLLADRLVVVSLDRVVRAGTELPGDAAQQIEAVVDRLEIEIADVRRGVGNDPVALIALAPVRIPLQRERPALARPIRAEAALAQRPVLRGFAPVGQIH